MKKNIVYSSILSSVLALVPMDTMAKFSISQSGVVVSAASGEANISVRNLGQQEILLFASESEKETKAISGQSLFMLSPPISKLKPGESQVIRIFLKDKNINKEMLGRLRFQELTSEPNNKTKTIINSAYNIAAVARPALLVENPEPWKGLKVENSKSGVVLKNDTLYVVRMMKTIRFKVSGKIVSKNISNGYILPGSSITFNKVKYSTLDSIEINPVSTTASILPPYTITK
ncbi:fimbria/pilus periplasmic chaperone [Photobacterium damselae]